MGGSNKPLLPAIHQTSGDEPSIRKSLEKHQFRREEKIVSLLRKVFNIHNSGFKREHFVSLRYIFSNRILLLPLPTLQQSLVAQLGALFPIPIPGTPTKIIVSYASQTELIPVTPDTCHSHVSPIWPWVMLMKCHQIHHIP